MKIYLLPTSIIIFLFICTGGCTVNKAKIDSSLKKHFDSLKVDGTFALLNNSTGSIVLYNKDLYLQRCLPASTFKIVNALIGLETGRITDTKMIIPWDKVERPRKEWNKDLSMEEAFKVSSVPYFQEVARRIGKDTMKRWIDSLHYGNMKIDGPVDSFWLNNTLKVSPDEQLGLVKKLYFDKLPFRKDVQQSVRDVMLQENNTLYKWSYKTGAGNDEQKNMVGWMVGWIEENRHVYFFTMLIKTPDNTIDIQAARLKIGRGILTQLGFFKGEM